MLADEARRSLLVYHDMSAALFIPFLFVLAMIKPVSQTGTTRSHALFKCIKERIFIFSV